MGDGTSKLLISLITLIVSGVALSVDDIPASLVEDFFHHHVVGQLVICTCSVQRTSVLIKSLAESWHKWLRPETADTLSAALTRTDNSKLGVFIEFNCAEGWAALNTSWTLGLVSGNISWLVWSYEPPPSELSTLGLRVDIDLTWASPRSGFVSLLDVYQTGPDAPLTVTHAGYWEPEKGLNYRLSRALFSGRRTLQGRVLRAAIVMPVRGSVSKDDSRIHLMNQFNTMLCSHMQDMFNFSLQLVTTDSYDGLANLLQQGTVDIGLTSLAIRSQWLDILDYSAPVWRIESSMIFRHPRQLGITDELFSPFEESAWVSSFVIYLFIMIALRLSTWVEFRFREEPRPQSTEDVESSWSSVAVLVVGAVSMQGVASESAWISWRVATLLAFLLAVLLNTYYSASMVTALLLPPRTIITSLGELCRSSMGLGALDDVLDRERIQGSSDETVQQLLRRGLTFMTLNAGVEKLARESFAFHGDVAALHPAIENILDNEDKCSLKWLPIFAPEFSYLPVTKGSPFKEMLTYGIRMAWERGLSRRLEAEWRPVQPYCTSSGAVWSVTLGSTAPAFLLLIAGLLLAAALLGIEFKVFRMMRTSGTPEHVRDREREHAARDLWGLQADMAVRRR